MVRLDAFRAPNGGLPGFPVVDPAVGRHHEPGVLPADLTGRRLDGQPRLRRLRFPATGDPDEYLGTQANPFPYPAIDPDPSAGDPTIAGNASDTVLRTNALALSIAPAGQQVDLNTGAPIAPNTLPTGQGSQNVIIGKSGGEANLFGNIPGKGYGIDVTVSLATKINSIFRIQDQDVFDTPLVAGSQYPAGIFNCRQIWSGVVQNYIPGVRLTGNLRISPAITKDGKLRIAKATVNTSAADSRRAVGVPDALPLVQRGQRGGLPDDDWCRWSRLHAGGPDARPGSRRFAWSDRAVRCARLPQQPAADQHRHACRDAGHGGV